MRKLIAVLSLLTLTTFAGVARANVPSRFTVQGVLRDSGGALSTTTVTYVVKIWQSQTSTDAGDLVFTFAPTNNMVAASNGLFTIPVTLAATDVAAINAALSNASVTALWLEVEANGFVYSRQPLTQVLMATLSDGLSSNCSGCVADGMISAVSASKVTGLASTVETGIDVSTAPAAQNFKNNWGVYVDTVTWEKPSYYKDPFGIVHLKGLLAGGTVETVAFVLAPGYVPAKNHSFAVVSNAGFCRIDVGGDGTLTVRTGCGTSFISLDSVVFRVP